MIRSGTTDMSNFSNNGSKNIFWNDCCVFYNQNIPNLYLILTFGNWEHYLSTFWGDLGPDFSKHLECRAKMMYLDHRADIFISDSAISMVFKSTKYSYDMLYVIFIFSKKAKKT